MEREIQSESEKVNEVPRDKGSEKEMERVTRGQEGEKKWKCVSSCLEQGSLFD